MVFPGPLSWFQKKLWRLKWLEFMVFNCVILVLILLSDGGASLKGGSAGNEAPFVVLLLTPLFAFVWWGMFRLWALLCRIVPLLAWIPRVVASTNDRLLAQFCEEQIIFIKEY